MMPLLSRPLEYFKKGGERLGGPPILIFISALAVVSNGPRWLEVAAAIVSAVGAIWASSQQIRDAKLLAEKNEELKALALRTVDTVTGGSSVCYLMPYGRVGPTAMVTPHGSFPLYEVVVRVTDLERFEEIRARNEAMPNYFAAEIATLRIGEVAPGLSRMLPVELFIHHGDRRGWNVFFTARNGNWTQLIRMRRIGNEWRMATRVLRANGRDIAFELVVDGYPLLPDGSVEWNAQNPSQTAATN